MKKYSFFAFLIFTCLLFSCNQDTDQQHSDTDDLLELPPAKKINQSPPKKIDTKSGISTGIFTHLEQGDYYYFHLKNGKERESFMLRSAYQGADKLNIDNWKNVKGKEVRITWEVGEEKDSDTGNLLVFKKVLAVELVK